MLDARLELGGLGIISGDQKRSLEAYVDSRFFDQRKTYDEYTISTTNEITDLTTRDLMVLAEEFKVTVLEDSVLLSDRT